MTLSRILLRVLPAALVFAAVGASAQTATPLAPLAPVARPASAPRPATVPPINPGASFQGSTPRAGQTGADAVPDAATIFGSWDTDKNHSLSLDEFKLGWQRAREGQVVARMAGLFRAVDANHDGLLQPAEYANLPLIKRAGSAAPPLSTFDTNKSNSLDKQEYLRMVEALVQMAESQGGQ
jgi:hypothetical protein